MKTTCTYKVVDDVQIQADVYSPDGAEARPVVVWLHGGCLINGNRGGVADGLREFCAAEGFVLISLDYRLGPEVKLPAIIEDIQDAFRWIRRECPGQFGVDPGRVVVTGGSAGGYLAMMTGICVEPRPVAALATYYGYGDVDGPWYSQPSAYYREHRELISKDEAYKAVGREVLTETEWDTDIAQARSRYYWYLRQNGLWTREITGFDPASQRAKLDPYCPVRNITPQYPPILMIHGTEDTDVPYELSAAMAGALKKCSVRHELIAIPGADHGLRGGDEGLIAEAKARMQAFIKEHVQ